MKTKLFGGLLVTMGCVLGLQPAAAATATFFGTGTGLGARADFTTSAGLLAVTVTNTLAPNQIISAAQAVSDIIFTLSNAPGSLGATTASAQLVNVGAGGTVTNVSGSPVRWLGQGPPPPNGTGFFSIVGNTITMEAIGGGQPSQMILPAGGPYTNANGSITGGQFNPFVNGSAAFTLALAGVSAATTITGATFSFGTGPDTFITGHVPIPGTLPLFATGLLGLWALRRKRKTISTKSLDPVVA